MKIQVEIADDDFTDQIVKAEMKRILTIKLKDFKHKSDKEYFRNLQQAAKVVLAYFGIN